MDAKTLGAEPCSHCAGFYSDTGSTDHFGLTKRELFAAMAMQGFLSSPQSAKVRAPADMIARDSCVAADALLEELAKNQP